MTALKAMRSVGADRALTAVYTFMTEIRELRLRTDPLGIVAPCARERTAFQKERGSYSVAVMHGEVLVLQYCSVYIHLSTLPLYGILYHMKSIM